MASSLVTQVQQGDDDKIKQKAAAMAAAKPATAKKPKKEPSFCWKLFCCCCKYAPDEDDDKSSPRPDAKEDKQTRATPTAAGADGKRDDVQWLLGPLADQDKGKKCLVLDLDETLVHSSFTPVSDADFIIDIELDGNIHKVYVRKRPYVDEFLIEMGKKFEVVIFTASLAKYADPLLDKLDTSRVVRKRLFRESCVQHFGNYVKDLSLLGRKLEHSIIIDNSALSYMFQPDNAVPITSWFNDRSDTELQQLVPYLDQLIEVDDVTVPLGAQNRAAQAAQQQSA